MASADGGMLAIEVVYSPGPGVVRQVALTLPEPSCVQDALQQSGLLEEFAELRERSPVLGVWGKLRGPGDLLRDKDRVEIYRPLRVDPKEARRLRYKSHRDKLTSAAGPKSKPKARPKA